MCETKKHDVTMDAKPFVSAQKRKHETGKTRGAAVAGERERNATDVVACQRRLFFRSLQLGRSSVARSLALVFARIHCRRHFSSSCWNRIDALCFCWR